MPEKLRGQFQSLLEETPRRFNSYCVYVFFLAKFAFFKIAFLNLFFYFHSSYSFFSLHRYTISSQEIKICHHSVTDCQYTVPVTNFQYIVCARSNNEHALPSIVLLKSNSFSKSGEHDFVKS